MVRRSDKQKHNARDTMPRPLPEKDCACCRRPFRWRKKWERCWGQVKYCSKRCRGHARGTP